MQGTNEERLGCLRRLNSGLEEQLLERKPECEDIPRSTSRINNARGGFLAPRGAGGAGGAFLYAPVSVAAGAGGGGGGGALVGAC